MDFQNITDMFLVNMNNHRPMAKADAGHMKKYASAYEQGTYLMMGFEKVDSITGDLSLVDDDITVIMPSDQISGRPYDLRYRAQKLEDIYCVKVTSIDSAKKIVYVSHQEARMEKRPDKVRSLYNLGREDAEAKIKQVQRFLREERRDRNGSI